MTLLYTDPLFLQHATGTHHPERPDRLRAVWARLEQSGLAARCRAAAVAPLAPEALYSTHAPPMVEAAREVCAQGGGYLDGDTPVCPESFHVALCAAGACVSAVDAVLGGQDRTALCLVRPPGHHATPSRSMGFCLFNNVALAARQALARGLSRVLVIDWDVHHGNGTQDAFYDDPQVTFFSIHRHGHGFYPGTGDTDETGTGAGLGTNYNAPVAYGTSRSAYLAQFAALLEKAADRCRPELVLVSAGFDADGRDPIGSLGLGTEDFIALSRLVLDVARTHANGRLVSCLEGGYNLDALAEGVQGHLEVLLGDGGAGA